MMRWFDSSARQHGWVEWCLYSALCVLLAAPAWAQIPVDVPGLEAVQSELQGASSEQETLILRARSQGVPLTFDGDEAAQLVGIGPNGLPVYWTTFDTPASVLVGASRVWATTGEGFRLTGSGIPVGLWDIGPARRTHLELQGADSSRVWQADLFSTGPSRHATGVAGLIAASGERVSARGIAYESGIWGYDWRRDRIEVATVVQDGLLISNHSYGPANGWAGPATMQGLTAPVWMGDLTISAEEDYRFGRYGASSRQWDQISHSAPYFQAVAAAGNDRGDSPEAGAEHFAYVPNLGYRVFTETRQPDGGTGGFDSLPQGAATSKNVLSVGAVRFNDDGTIEPTTFSSFGPTDDGRIKPDLVAPGEGLETLWNTSDDAYFVNVSGTSYSAPIVSGVIALLQDEYRQRNPGRLPLRASEIRALLFNTAEDLGSFGPDYQTGWGMPNAARAAECLRHDNLNELTIHTRTVRAGSPYTVRYRAAGTGDPLRVTIAWTDPAGTEGPLALDNPTSSLVHDVDLRVIGPDGAVNLPWVLNPSQPQQAAGRGTNTRDNAEQVLILDPVPGGLYEVEVRVGRGAQQDVSIVVGGHVIGGLERDDDGDGIPLAFEDRDGDGNPFVDDTDGDGLPDYLDTDDDGDGIPTADECADPDGDGDPSDACIGADGMPRYLTEFNLPVELTAFDLDPLGAGNVLLRWTTATEENNAGFGIEHRPLACAGFGSCSWAEIGWVNGAGTTSEPQAYTFDVTDLPAGIHQFRLRQVDFDGTFVVSQVLETTVAVPGDFDVQPAYPNPFAQSTQFRISVEEAQRVRVDAYDVVGRRVARLFEGRVTASLPETIRWDNAALPAGMYLVRVQGESFSTQLRVVKAGS